MCPHRMPVKVPMGAMLCLLLSSDATGPQRTCFHSAGPMPDMMPVALTVGPKPWGRPQAPLSSRKKLQKGNCQLIPTAHAEARLWLSTSSEVLLICIVRFPQLL